MQKKTWGLFVLIVGLGTAVLLSVSNAFVPTVADVEDPLGRPSALSLEVIHSASEFDRLAGALVPKHGDLSQRIQTLNIVADDLDTLVGKAGGLPQKATSVNAHTRTVRSTAQPLPDLIADVTGRARQANPVVGGLGNAISGVTVHLEAITGGLIGIYSDLAALGPRATTINELLAKIQDESRRVRAFGPALTIVSTTLGPVLQGGSGDLIGKLLGVLGSTTSSSTAR